MESTCDGEVQDVFLAFFAGADLDIQAFAEAWPRQPWPMRLVLAVRRNH
jgi:hypothetical protein